MLLLGGYTLRFEGTQPSAVGCVVLDQGDVE